MKWKYIIVFVILLFPSQLFCWGFYAHKKINRLAVFTLPSELMAFYKRHIEFVSAHAVDPDMRRYAIPDEAPRHYIDIDHYGEEPFLEVPRKWFDALEKYSEDTLKAYGIVPWHIEKMYNILVSEFEQKDLAGVLKVSADLGHYVGDAHVPLHTTENYNGQLTDQHGIHGFWESRLPELFSEDYSYWTGKASFESSVNDLAWDAVEKSHASVDSVLLMEKKLSSSYPSDQRFAMEQRGRSTNQVYSKDYSTEYHLLMDGMVERRMRKAIIMVGSLWYSAWVEAGKPLMSPDEFIAEKAELDEEQERLKAKRASGRIFGREHSD